LRYGDIQVLETGNDDVLAFRRSFEGKSLTTAVNFSDKPQAISLERTGKLLVSSLAVAKRRKADPAHLGAHEARVYQS
jgi:hypothetical protein